MRRREFLVGAARATAAAALSPVLRGWAQDAAVIPASLSVKPHNQVSVIPPDFTGLSYESAQLAYPPFFSADNTALVAYCRTLGKQGVLRIGGNTSEFTRWTEQETAAPVPMAAGADTSATEKRPVTPITPASIRDLAGFLDATGWKLIYGINLGHNTPQQAAIEAKFVHETMGPRLIALQIGNEPDRYGKQGFRPSTWNFDAYLAQWLQFARAIRRHVHGVRFGAPDIASNISWVVDFAEKARKEAIFLTYHHYAEGPPSDPTMNIDRLLHPNSKFDSEVAQMQQASRSSGLPVRLVETNSCYNGGKEGVSDTFASALWGGDYMFHIAQAGQTGVYLHGGGHSFYTPIAGSLEGGFTARPVYYGMLLFDQALGSVLVESVLDAGGANATAYAVRFADNDLGVAIFNKDASKALRLNINPGIPVHSAEVLRLAGPSLDSKTGVTFGGSEVSSSGGWSPSQTETPDHTDSAVTLDLPAASAAWLRIA